MKRREDAKDKSLRKRVKEADQNVERGRGSENRQRAWEKTLAVQDEKPNQKIFGRVSRKLST